MKTLQKKHEVIFAQLLAKPRLESGTVISPYKSLSRRRPQTRASVASRRHRSRFTKVDAVGSFDESRRKRLSPADGLASEILRMNE